MELCSGTGKQSEYIVKKGTSAEITLSDISKESCDILKESFSSENVKVLHTDLDSLLDNSNNEYDLIFVSYALYYTKKNMFSLCTSLTKALKPGGRLVVVGPYKNNNSELFGLLSTLGIAIPRSVRHCCDQFMEELLCELLPYCSSSKSKFVENKQEWKSVEELHKYWKSSTFYDQKNEAKFIQLATQLIKENETFNITKRIAMFEFTLRHDL